MRFTSAIFAALAIAFMGVQALPAPDQPTQPAYKSSAAPAPTYKPEPYKPDNKTDHPDYDIVCKPFAFFHNWDIDCGDLACGPTKGEWVYDCAKDCLENEDCDATVSYDGCCYPKTLDYFQVSNLKKSDGRDLAIEGCCKDLEENYKKTKCYPDGFLDCCYDKEICTKVYKKGKEPKKEEPKKEEKKW
ncbi:hypothetical protein QFC22_006623 [Naganishia vaughanmartiniae]|uniref:Uncharacterized protein n=1 Tax=Naganishia vaughanmartiniae TaxID=1424756 RepID=A0ACC2WIX5_9TREE|nr:hypothetical protein QFC22_006623 [Naganishia vaughanmartiniae]